MKNTSVLYFNVYLSFQSPCFHLFINLMFATREKKCFKRFVVIATHQKETKDTNVILKQLFFFFKFNKIKSYTSIFCRKLCFVSVVQASQQHAILRVIDCSNRWHEPTRNLCILNTAIKCSLQCLLQLIVLKVASYTDVATRYLQINITK